MAEHKKTKHKQHPSPQNDRDRRLKSKSADADLHFRPSADVKGLRFGGQLLVKTLTVRRASALELARIIAVPPAYLNGCPSLPFPSTAAYIPTDFTILAQRAWHTLTLGLGTSKSKVAVFVFESEDAKAAAAKRQWPATIPLGDLNGRLIRGLFGYELARFKFRKGSLTFYVYAVRRMGVAGFACTGDLRRILEAVAALKDFVGHTAMLAFPGRSSITFSDPPV